MPKSTDFLTNPQNFCNRWVIKMPGGQTEGAGLQGKAATFLTDRTVNQPPVGSAIPKVRAGYTIAANSVRVQWHEYSPGRLELVIDGSAHHGNLQFQNVPLDNDWFNAFILPWGIGKAARMELPDQSLTGAPVRAFFTAEMNGCAFLAAGNPLSPVVAHMNVNVAVGALTLAQKDQELERMTTSVLKGARGGPNIGNETATVLRWVTPDPAAPGTFGGRLARQGHTYADTGNEIANYDAQTTANLHAQHRKFDIAPTTDIRLATMGVLDAATRRWTFFYQRNICTTYAHKQRIGKLGGIRKRLFGDWRTPQNVTTYEHIGASQYVEIWPNGAGVLNVPAHGDPTQA